MANEQLSQTAEAWIAAIPAACVAMLGWVGYCLSKDDPTMSTKRFVGGVLLSAFTGGCVSILLLSMGFPPILATVIASAIGSSGIKGYEWLIQRSKDSVKK